MQNIRINSVTYDKLRQNECDFNAFCQIISCKTAYYCIVKENEAKAKKYLLQLGFQPNLKGYHLLARLIGYALDKEEILPLKYCGYKRLSDDFGVDEQSIEKDIQNAISSAWLRGDVNILYKEFGETLDENKGKPTNKQFVLTALERIR